MKYLYIDVCNGNIIKERYIANGVNLQTYFEFYDGLALINYQGRFGYVDKYARIVIPFIYDEATNFSNGISKTKIRGAWGSIDLKNNTVVRHMYKDIGLQIVYNVLLKYDIAKRYKYYISVRKDGKWGLLDKDENEILKPIFYDEIELVKVLSDDYVKIILDGRETIVNKNGKIIS